MIYFDTSALLRLVRAEQWSADLDAYLNACDPDEPYAISVVGLVEARRVLVRAEATLAEWRRALGLLSIFDQVELTESVVDDAGRLPNRHLRSLDAIHVASALQIMPALSTVLSYDPQLIEAAVQAGLPVASPGMDTPEAAESS